MRSILGAVLDRAVRNQATPPIPYTSSRPSFFGSRSRDDRESAMRAMSSVGTLFAIVDRISTAVAKPNWHLYRKSTTGKLEDRQEVTDHLALRVWNNPNDFYSQVEFIESCQQHFELTGEMYWVLERDPRVRSVVTGMWPVRPDKMSPVPSAERFLAGWIYTSPDGEQVPLRTDEVIQVTRPNPLDPYRGMGAVQAVLVQMDATRYSMEWNRNFFVNGAEPGGLIQLDKRLGDDEWDEFQARWAETHRGVSNAHRVAILEQGSTWVENKYTARDMQFAELLNVSREIIREAFGIHGHMLGLSEDVNLANAQAAEITFARWTTVPRLERWKGALNNRFLPLFGVTGQGLEFDYESPIPDDAQGDANVALTRAQAFSVLVQAGVVQEDAAREAGLSDVAFTGPPSPTPVLTGAPA